MSKQLIGGLVAAALLSAVVPGSARASAQALESNQNDPLRVSVTQESLKPASDKALQSPTWSATTARVNAYPLENRQAATVYIRNIPVLTYVGDVETAEIVSGWLSESTPSTNDTVARAVDIAVKLEQMADDTVEFTARWHDDSYMVMAGDAPLVALGDSIHLPAATDNDAENILQVTNRLRRLLSDSEPVTEVVGRPEPPAPVQQVAVRSTASGMASWYGPGFHGRTSASGEAFNQYAMTAAHRTLPFGTQVRVTNLNNGQQVVVRINDRGPYSHGRIIDLSAGAAGVIGLQSAGVGPVQIEVLN